MVPTSSRSLWIPLLYSHWGDYFLLGNISASSFPDISCLLIPSKVTSSSVGSPSSMICIKSFHHLLSFSLQRYENIFRQITDATCTSLQLYLQRSESTFTFSKPSYVLIPTSTLGKRIFIMFSIIFCLCQGTVVWTFQGGWREGMHTPWSVKMKCPVSAHNPVFAGTGIKCKVALYFAIQTGSFLKVKKSLLIIPLRYVVTILKWHFESGIVLKSRALC